MLRDRNTDRLPSPDAEMIGTCLACKKVTICLASECRMLGAHGEIPMLCAECKTVIAVDAEGREKICGTRVGVRKLRSDLT